MVAIGCLLLIVLPLIGLVLGSLIGGTHAAIGCAIGGFLVAVAICGVSGYALVKSSHRE